MLGTVGTVTPLWNQYFEGKVRDAIIRRLRMSDGAALAQSTVRELTVARQNAQNRGDTQAALMHETRIRQLMSYNAQVRGEGTGADIAAVVAAAEKESNTANVLAPFASVPKVLLYIGIAWLVLNT